MVNITGTAARVTQASTVMYLSKIVKNETILEYTGEDGGHKTPPAVRKKGMIVCSDCGNVTSDSKSICPHCGEVILIINKK